MGGVTHTRGHIVKNVKLISDRKTTPEIDGRDCCSHYWHKFFHYRSLPKRWNWYFLLCGSFLTMFFLMIRVPRMISYNVWWELYGPLYNGFFLAGDINLKEAVHQELYNSTYIRPVLEGTMTYNQKMGNNYLCRNHSNDGSQGVFFLWVIKSAVNNSQLRNNIRMTWGAADVLPYVETRKVFVIGMGANLSYQNEINEEQRLHGDLIQGDFLDTYYNNTLKLMTGFRWATRHCSQAKFIGFTDDDFFVSPYNVVNLFQSVPEIENKKFIMGHIVLNGRPFRGRESKWYISKVDYPFSRYPNFPVAGSFFLSMPTAKVINAALRYTRKVPFDDVLIGFIARSLGIRLLHSDDIYTEKEEFYSDIEKAYKSVISVHDIKGPGEMLKYWKIYNKLRVNKLWKNAES